MWFTLLIIIACLVGIPLGMLLLLMALLILLPIHMGGSGFYRQEGYAASGWVKALAGLVGVVFEYTDTGGHVQVVLGKWVIWQPKEDKDEDLASQDASPPSVTEPVKTDMPFPPTVVSQKADEKVKMGLDVSPSKAENPKQEPDAPQARVAPVEQGDDASTHVFELDDEEQEEKQGEEEDQPSFWTRWKMLRIQISRYWGYSQEARPILWHFVKRLMRTLRFRYVDVDVVFGADDPAQTGRLFGYVEAIRHLLGKRTSLVLTPDFTQSRIEGAGALEFSFYLSRFLWAVCALVVRGGMLGVKIWWIERRIKRRAVLHEVS